MISSETSSTMVRPYAIWMISSSTPTPSASGGYFSSQRNASLSRRRSNTLDWSSRPCGYGSNKGLWSHGMANPNKGQGSPVLPWLCELLLEVYPQLLQCCLPPLCAHSQDPVVGLGFT